VGGWRIVDWVLGGGGRGQGSSEAPAAGGTQQQPAPTPPQPPPQQSALDFEEGFAGEGGVEDLYEEEYEEEEEEEFVDPLGPFKLLLSGGACIMVSVTASCMVPSCHVTGLCCQGVGLCYSLGSSVATCAFLQQVDIHRPYTTFGVQVALVYGKTACVQMVSARQAQRRQPQHLGVHMQCP